MKHIKLFETKKYEDTFYFIPYKNKDLISLAIDKIKMSKTLRQEIQEDMESVEHIVTHIHEDNFIGIYLGIYMDGGKRSYQYWTTYKHNKEEGYRSFTDDNYKYGGELIVSDYDLDIRKYNL